MLTKRQLHNRQRRLEAEMSTPPWRTLPVPPDRQANLGSLDEITLVIQVLGKVVVKSDVTVMEVEHHGDYSIVHYRDGNWNRGTAVVGLDGPPPEEKSVEIEIRKKVARQREPENDSDYLEELDL